VVVEILVVALISPTFVGQLVVDNLLGGSQGALGQSESVVRGQPEGLADLACVG
jgi:hypothetical protein